MGNSSRDFRAHVIKYKNTYLNDAADSYLRIKGEIAILADLSKYFKVPFLNDYLRTINVGIQGISGNLDVICNQREMLEEELKRKGLQNHIDSRDNLLELINKYHMEEREVNGLNK